MQIILEANGLWEMIEPLKRTQSNNKKDKTTIAFLYQALPEEQLLQITKHKTAKAIWDALKTRHIGEERVQQARLQTLKSDFEMLHMKEDEAIDTFTAKLTTLIVASIEKYSDLGEMSVEEAIGRLKTFEERIKVKKGKAFEDHDKLLFTKHNDNEDILSQDYNEAMEKHRDFSKVKCYNCNEYGHYASHCHKRDQRQQRQEASNLVEEDLEPTLLMASTSFNKTQKKSSKDTPTNKSIWFAKDYDHEDSKFGEIILEEDKEGHDQDYDKLRSNENEDIEDTSIVIMGENIGPKPNPIRILIQQISTIFGRQTVEVNLEVAVADLQVTNKEEEVEMIKEDFCEKLRVTFAFIGKPKSIFNVA
ncbi:zinc finger, CCHC-type containing protein [Tanacetum coccineum]|uniref:Zinc finger, CCHC-type containing protein n=1 Tax=Tanacetum coccineum TaxID=301880 RepID=A0ABQ4YW19_9ASTR